MIETRALLLTDVVDSTKLVSELGDAGAAELWARHDRVARDLLVPHHGREIDKSDGFLLLFDTAADAVAYARAYHAAIAPLGLTARAGVHLGPVLLRANDPADVARGAKPLEVEGIAKALTARVMSTARPGQTLATASAAPEGATSHGHWRFKGVSEPTELFEVTGDGLPPADTTKCWRVLWRQETWVPVREVEHGLPSERDAFVGRENDLVELAGRLDDGARLVTVIGIGGAGKTRLALHHAWTWLGSWPGGAWFCDVSEARDLDGVIVAVARALGVPLGQEEPVAQLGHAIAGRGRCLVLLDNLEQVANEVRPALERWLDRAVEVQFVVTSREVLAVPGEVVLALAPLDDADADALFVSRARQAKRDFVVTDAAEIRALVRLLDGLPLAIELAAARVRVMTPALLLTRMNERFRLLASTGARRSRQATLRGAIDWSWDLLTPDEQAALAQLSVFEGGFTLATAESVLALDQLWSLDAVQSLVDKSLVYRAGDERFDLLVSVQEYAAEKLGVDRSAAEVRHGACFAALGQPGVLEAMSRHGGGALRAEIAAELHNLRAACRRALARGDGGTATATLRAWWTVTHLQGPFQAGVSLAAEVVGCPELSAADRATAESVLADALAAAGRTAEATALFGALLERQRALGDRTGEAMTLYQRANLLTGDAARAAFEEALARYRELGDAGGLALVSGGLGVWYAQRGDFAGARALFESARARFVEEGDRRSEGNMWNNLGILAVQERRWDDARLVLEQALAAHAEVGNRTSQGRTLTNLGALAAIRGDRVEAGARYAAAIAVHRAVGNRRSEGVVLGEIGLLACQDGALEEASGSLEAALVAHRDVGDRRLEGVTLGRLGSLRAAQGRADDAAACFDAGEALLVEVKVAPDLEALRAARAAAGLPG